MEQRRSQGASVSHHHDGSEDVECDYCTERKRKATKSCLQCLVSYCDEHLRPHYEEVPIKKHKLTEACRFQDITCSHHNELEMFFCRTDQKCICSVCAIKEHKGHDIILAAAEKKERLAEIGMSQQKIKQRIKDREESVEVLQQEVEAINGSAKKAVKGTIKMCTELVELIGKISSVVTKQIIQQQKIEVTRAKELKEKLEKELTELRRKDAQLEQFSKTNETMFLKSYPSLSEPKDSPAINTRPLRYFEDVTTAVSLLTCKAMDTCSKEWGKILETVIDVDVLLPQEPKTKAELSRFSLPLTLDPNTANKQLLLSEDNSEVTSVKDLQPYPDHPERFRDKFQVLGRKCPTGRCYWEVKWSGLGVLVAVAYKDISRAGDESRFGNNDKSWALECSSKGDCTFKHNREKVTVTGPVSSSLGVFLDHRAGTLSFYSISETITLLHKVETTFTQPLYPGLCVQYYGVKATVTSPSKCEL